MTYYRVITNYVLYRNAVYLPNKLNKGLFKYLVRLKLSSLSGYALQSNERLPNAYGLGIRALYNPSNPNPL